MLNIETRKQITTRYLVLGTIAGLCFLLGVYTAIAFALHKSLSVDLMLDLHKNILFWLIDLVPAIFTSMAFFLARHNMKDLVELDESMQGLIKKIKKTANFTDNIGKGNFDTEYVFDNDNDLLGKSLVNMRNSLRNAAKKESETAWIVSGVAEIGNILRSYNDLEELSDHVIAYLVQKTDSVQGAFYVVDDDTKDKLFINMMGSYAYNRKKYINASFKFGEGLVGQAAFEQMIVHRNEIPENYMTVSSGLLGDKKPKSILIVPMIDNEVVYGVIEICSMHDKYTELKIKFIQEVSSLIARTIFSVKVNERTRRLLKESQKMSEELSEQQKQLLANAQKMKEAQEALVVSNVKLEEKVEEVNRSQQRLQVLLENASEVITIFEEDQKIRYVSPSVKHILGYDQNELIGKPAGEKVYEKGINNLNDLFSELLTDNTKVVKTQFSYVKKNGERVWMEVLGKNLLNNPAIQGIVTNSRDITERRKAEKEQRIRGKMQALSENSPDLILRIEQNGILSYINPAISGLTGIEHEGLIGKRIDETILDPTIANFLKYILSALLEKNEKLETEFTFPSIVGDKIMSVRAIPEFSDDEKFESTLVVASDITDAKQKEKEIQKKNHDITESINAAFRIQKTLMPTAIQLNKYFPNSFMVYKPKDIVSGDFPIMYRNVFGDIYIAVCDCTGHGVPGALMSFVGYFMFKESYSSTERYSAGELLDKVSSGMTKLLKQDTVDTETREGMDAAVWRINLQDNEVQFAGAHRPMVVVRGASNTLEEVKADKYPVGGLVTHYKNRQAFVNNIIKINQGDTICFFTDGFPDQFGGADGKKKLGSKTCRDLILKHSTMQMPDMGNALWDEFQTWRGSHKQMDDVLIIGVRF